MLITNINDMGFCKGQSVDRMSLNLIDNDIGVMEEMSELASIMFTRSWVCVTN